MRARAYGTTVSNACHRVAERVGAGGRQPGALRLAAGGSTGACDPRKRRPGSLLGQFAFRERRYAPRPRRAVFLCAARVATQSKATQRCSRGRLGARTRPPPGRRIDRCPEGRARPAPNRPASAPRRLAPPPALTAAARLPPGAQAAHSVFRSALVKKAFAVARSAHDGQLRKSGEPVLAHAVQTVRLPPLPRLPPETPACFSNESLHQPP